MIRLGELLFLGSFGLGTLIFGESPTWMSAAGIALIIAAGVAATLLSQRPRAAVSAPTES